MTVESIHAYGSLIDSRENWKSLTADYLLASNKVDTEMLCTYGWFA